MGFRRYGSTGSLTRAYTGVSRHTGLEFETCKSRISHCGLQTAGQRVTVGIRRHSRAGGCRVLVNRGRCARRKDRRLVTRWLRIEGGCCRPLPPPPHPTRRADSNVNTNRLTPATATLTLWVRARLPSKPHPTDGSTSLRASRLCHPNALNGDSAVSVLVSVIAGSFYNYKHGETYPTETQSIYSPVG